MSIRTLEWAFRQKTRKPIDKLCLIFLADDADGSEFRFSYFQLEEFAGASRQEVIDSIKRLEEDKIIELYEGTLAGILLDEPEK